MEIDTTNKKTAMSMDDVFLQRRFISKIVEESNPLGNRIKDYATTPADVQKEQKRIEHKLLTYRASIWDYNLVEIEDETNGMADSQLAHAQKKTKSSSKPTTPPGIK
jgi:hypothetical protein